MVKSLMVRTGAILLGFGLLTACGDPAAAPARPEAAKSDAAAFVSDSRGDDRREFASRGDRGGARDDRSDPRDEPTPMLGDRPLWSATSRLSSEDNAERAFGQHGADFDARNTNAYVAAAHAFLEKPPADVLTMKRRNGDTLYYAPGDNVFAVAREDGAPRTLFKPDEGMAYWREQEQREAERAEGGSRRDRG